MHDWQAVDRIFAEWDRPDSPGAALTITQGGEIVYERGYGSANLEYGIPITPETIFHVASVSKQFTTAAVLQLAAEGRLGLDDDVRIHLPYLPVFGPTLTLRHLIHHSSGLRDQWELLRWAGWRMDDVITQEHLLRMIRRQRELNFVPGAEHIYCNSGYTLLAEVVAAVSGQTFREYTAERFFGPLGMTSTFFYTDHEEIVPGRAYSYNKAGRQGWKKAVLSFANAGATSLFTTARDLARWLLHLDTLEGTPMAAEMQRPLVLNSGETVLYAGGLDVHPFRGLRKVGHGGSDAGYRSVAVRFPDHGLGVVILCNLGAMEPAKLGNKVAEVLLGEHLEPTPGAPQTVGVEALGVPLSDYEGSYMLRGIGFRIEIRAGGGKLVLEVSGEPQIELLPVAPDRFYAPAAEDTVTFARPPGGGPATSLALARFGRQMTAQRILPQPPLAELAVYEGDYYSAELDTVYRLRCRERGLVSEHQRLPDTLLLPTCPDQFEGDRNGTGTFVFCRAGGGVGQAESFRLTGTRCRNLLFERREG